MQDVVIKRGQYWLPETAVKVDSAVCRHKMRHRITGDWMRTWRVVECCAQEPDVDTFECTLCGEVQFARCDFDENFS